MEKNPQNQKSISQKKCGCYSISQQMEKKNIYQPFMVPLRSIEYEFDIVNAVANISLLQTYQNPTQKFLELQYSFPIEPNNCIYRFTAEFGNSRIQGVIKEKEVAKEEYRKAIQSGKQAAYGEINAESRDILTLRVGNVAPQQYVKVHIAFMQELTLSCNTFYQLRLPSTITPRYLSQLSPESIMAGYRKQKIEIQGSFFWTFKISLNTSQKVIFFDSHTHNLTLLSQNDNATESVFVLKKACIPNKDFVFTYTTENYQLPNCVFGRTDSGSSAMLSFIPKFCTLSLDDAYKASVQGTLMDTEIEHSKGEYIFLLDRSGSMEGARIQKAKQSLILFIKSLPADTYFNVVSFGSWSLNLFKSSVRYANKEVQMAVKQISKMTADMGGTEIEKPLREILTSNTVEGYPKQIFLLTDGGIFNTEKVVQMVKNNNKFARVNTIGIGNGASAALIVGCAEKGKGSHVFINDSQDPSQKIIQLLTDSLSPVISRMKLKYDKDLIESVIPNPESLPYILKNQIVNFYVTFKGQLHTSTSLIFSYQDSLNKLPYEAEITIDPEAIGDPLIDRMGHYKRLRLLQQSYANNSQLEEQMYFEKIVDKKARIIEQSVRYQILSTLTAFVCVQKELIDGKFQQIQSKGKVYVQIKKQMPLQMKNEQSLQNLVLQCQSLKSCSYQLKQKKSSFLSKQICKKKSSFGVLDTVTDFFKKILGKNERIQSMPRQKLSDSNQNDIKKIGTNIETLKRQQFFQQEIGSTLNNQYLEQLDQNKQIKTKIQPNKNINEIIAKQKIQGNWEDISLITQIFGQQVSLLIEKQTNVIAAITYLLARWIQIYYPEKQYKLIVKKAIIYLKKDEKYYKYLQIYNKYVK